MKRHILPKSWKKIPVLEDEHVSGFFSYKIWTLYLICNLLWTGYRILFDWHLTSTPASPSHPFFVLNEGPDWKGCFLNWFNVDLNKSLYIYLLLAFFLRSLSNFLLNRALSSVFRSSSFSLTVLLVFLMSFNNAFRIFIHLWYVILCAVRPTWTMVFFLVLGWGYENLFLLRCSLWRSWFPSTSRRVVP